MAGYEKKGSVAELKLPESVWTIGGYDELDYGKFFVLNCFV